ncbi:hypothetical protein EW146_g588 [Bondarzewia mesenterica]|uniref:Uncharacterized protein n=1 Tax=Bondarzewia mesenterica TaxID=1095465 RepID=A0A4S4M8P8_9AGAM|nr:hypothetical protein EW146_g588 [Bondarzewia mesenterica]
MTMAAVRVTPPAPKRHSPSLPSSPPIARGATARSAVTPRVSSSLASSPRRNSVKTAIPPVVNGQTRESLAASLKSETEHKEQDKDQAIATLKEENIKLSSSLNAAETRLSELYAEQNRMEEELVTRIEVVEKLRLQVRELEKEKRDLHRRYNEQTATFEAERQSFYDNEQHLKSRIQSLSQARRSPPVPRSPSTVADSESEVEWSEDDDNDIGQPSTPSQQTRQLDQDSESAEMTALRLELSTLSTSHNSLQNTLALLQSQLIDLKRVNNELQEENESYNILLRERTLSGQFNVMKQVGGGSASSSEQDEDEDADAETDETGDVGSTRNSARSALGTVDERAEDILDPDYDHVDDGKEVDEDGELSRNSRQTRHGRRRGASISHSVGGARGESLADLPITGPGLDLAAELGRAENKDILEGRTLDDRDRSFRDKSGKSGKKGSMESPRKLSHSSEASGLEPSGSLNDIDALRSEVKSLKDANKALSLYASKIIDRIIAQEGFEHVLAADYEKSPSTPSTAVNSKTSTSATKSQRRASMFSRSASNPTPTLGPVERLTTFDSPPLSSASTSPPARSQRRSLSFDWRGFSMFGGNDKKPDANSNLRHFTLQPGPKPTITGARKLETTEDEEDRRERERLHATMKLMGIEKPPAPPLQKSYSTPESAAHSPLLTPNSTSPNLSTAASRFSFFRRLSNAATSDTSSVKSAPSAMNGSPATLTQEALVQSEAENSLAALDAQERALGAEMAKGYSGGFTEIVPRRKSGSRRSRTSGGGSGSGSTVWSAGMSRHEEEGDD